MFEQLKEQVRVCAHVCVPQRILTTFLKKYFKNGLQYCKANSKNVAQSQQRPASRSRFLRTVAALIFVILETEILSSAPSLSFIMLASASLECAHRTV